TELKTEPVPEGGMPMKPDMPEERYTEPYTDELLGADKAPVSTAEITRETPSGKGGRLALILAVVAGLVLGGGASYYWFGIAQSKKMRVRVQELEKQMEAGRQAQADLAQVREEGKRLQGILDGQKKDSKQPVPKPEYYKVGKGALVYWVDDCQVKRKYYVYRAKGTKDAPKKITDKPVDKNMLLFRTVSSGTWRYAVTAVDLDGNETPLSEVLKLNFPLSK
ncbi:hypothetical protein JW933_01235, partial [candidate division FCPU426 bacterium]|nr:hypothetical protein [candidate division FCPU426 bacterium]